MKKLGRNLLFLCLMGVASSAVAADGAFSRALPSSVDSNKSVVTSRSTASSRGAKSNVSVRDTASKNTSAVASREMSRATTRNGAAQNARGNSVNARVNRAVAPRATVSGRDVSPSAGGATSRVASNTVSRTAAPRVTKSNVASGVRASVSGLFTGNKGGDIDDTNGNNTPKCGRAGGGCISCIACACHH